MAYATNLTQLTWLRFLTGLGLGAAFPNTVTLVAEYCPEKRRSFLIGLLLTGFVLGTALGGIVAAAVIARFGWLAVLKVGGIIPLALSFVMAWQLPESVRELRTTVCDRRRVGIDCGARDVRGGVLLRLAQFAVCKGGMTV